MLEILNGPRHQGFKDFIRQIHRNALVQHLVKLHKLQPKVINKMISTKFPQQQLNDNQILLSVMHVMRAT